MNQDTLFELESPRSNQVASLSEACPERETSGTVSDIRDKASYRRLASLTERLTRTDDPVERARLATVVRDLAELIVATNIREANAAGHTWREIAHRLDVPFQTLHRRYAQDA